MKCEHCGKIKAEHVRDEEDGFLYCADGVRFKAKIKSRG